MSSINPNRSSLIIARLESSFELSSFPLEQISIFYKIQYNMQMSISYLKRYEIYFMGSKIDDFLSLGTKG